MTYAMKLAAPLFLATLTTAQVAQAGSATGTMNVFTIKISLMCYLNEI
ncbi:hypothetical protein N9M38_04340 [Planktomarina temperata]|nr:hypothetical protein [Planktomarina temperata]